MSIARTAALRTLAARISERIPERLLREDPRFAQLQARHQKLTDAVKALETLRTTRNAQENDSGHAIKVTRTAQELADKVRTLRETTKADAELARAEFLAAARTQTGMLANGFAAELRAKFAQLDAGKQMSVLMDYAKKGSGPEFAALVDAPRLLTGLNDEMVGAATEHFFKTHCPEVVSTMAAYDDLVEGVSSGIEMASMACDDAMNSNANALRAAAQVDAAYATAENATKEVF